MSRVLLTNDDGIGAPGLRALAREAHRRGIDVVVAAPLSEASGTSAAVTAVEHNGQIVVERRELPGAHGVPAYAVAASPAFIVLLALRGAFGPPPDVVLSGINRGANVGAAVVHSGTVGATLTASHAGLRALAVSLDVLSPVTTSAGHRSRTAAPPTEGRSRAAVAGRAAAAQAGNGTGGNGAAAPAGGNGAGNGAGGGVATASLGAGTATSAALAAVDRADDEARHWAGAAELGVRMLSLLAETPAGTVLNLNVPDVHPDAVRGLRRAGLARFGQVQVSIAEAGDGFVRTAVQVADEPLEPGTDLAGLAEGYAVVTPIRAPADATDVPLDLEAFMVRHPAAPADAHS